MSKTFKKSMKKFNTHKYISFHQQKKPSTKGKLSTIGPGGINCTCCVPLHPSKLKPATRRFERRKLKQILTIIIHSQEEI